MSKENKKLPYNAERNLDGYSITWGGWCPAPSDMVPEMQGEFAEILGSCAEWSRMGEEERAQFIRCCTFLAWKYGKMSRANCGRTVKNTLEEIARAAEDLKSKLETVHEDAQGWIIRAYQDPDPGFHDRRERFEQFLELLPDGVDTLRRACRIAGEEAPERGHGHAEALILMLRSFFQQAGLPVRYRIDETTGREPVFLQSVSCAMEAAGMQPQSIEAVSKRIARAFLPESD